MDDCLGQWILRWCVRNTGDFRSESYSGRDGFPRREDTSRGLGLCFKRWQPFPTDGVDNSFVPRRTDLVRLARTLGMQSLHVNTFLAMALFYFYVFAANLDGSSDVLTERDGVIYGRLLPLYHMSFFTFSFRAIETHSDTAIVFRVLEMP